MSQAAVQITVAGMGDAGHVPRNDNGFDSVLVSCMGAALR